MFQWAEWKEKWKVDRLTGEHVCSQTRTLVDDLSVGWSLQISQLKTESLHYIGLNFFPCISLEDEEERHSLRPFDFYSNALNYCQFKQETVEAKQLMSNDPLFFSAKDLK